VFCFLIKVLKQKKSNAFVNQTKREGCNRFVRRQFHI
jgi:hypothetical protein